MLRRWPTLSSWGVLSLVVLGSSCGLTQESAPISDGSTDPAESSVTSDAGPDSDAGHDDAADASSDGDDAAPSPVLWSLAASLPDGRAEPTTALVGPQVLVAGGIDTQLNAPKAVLAYDEVSGAWSFAKELSEPRGNHCSTSFPDGRLLMAGGLPAFGKFPSPTSTVEIFDPALGDWAAAPPLNAPRWGHACAWLSGGAVLASGGIESTSPPTTIASAEILLPGAGWSVAPEMSSARSDHTATALADGRVLIAGGADASMPLATAELFDPASGTFVPTGSLHETRAAHHAVLLQTGNVLVVGGGNDALLASAEIYDVAQGVWHSVSSMAVARYGMTTTLLGSGHVLVTGGNGTSAASLASAELYDPVADTWKSAGQMLVGRAGHSAVRLASGKVLVFGGWVEGSSLPSDSAELFDPSAL